ncbi:MAG: MFS transporter [Coleofasciculaceae cyanobacterium]
MKKERLNLLQLWNMSFGFLGIQFGWGLQMANMSAIFEHLGADAHELPMLWLAAPFTGLVVQPIIGNMSDRTWGPLGRRRPYFLVGAILASIALLLMPHVSALWMAAGLLWILDTSANISMEPFRAFVGDLLPEEQRTQGFAMQSFLIGIGSVSASAFPWMLHHVFDVPSTSSNTQKIPLTVELSFYVGAALFLGAVLWTVLTTKEHPPEDIEAFKQQQKQQGGILNTFREIWSALQDMPQTMRQLAWVQWFTWLGLDCFFLYFPPAIARNIFGATDRASPLYIAGIEWAGICIAAYNTVCIVFSFVLPRLARATSLKLAHSVCLLCGAAGLLSLSAIANPYLLLLPMVGIGIVWAGVLAMPYAILVGSLPPERTGIYMGIFNFFIVLPQIFVSLGLGWVMQNLLCNNRLLAVVIGGAFLIVAALFMQRVQVVDSEENISEVDGSGEVESFT